MLRPRHAFLLLLAVQVLAASCLDAAPMRRPLSPRDGWIFDLLARSTDDVELLTPRQVALRDHRRQLGVEPRGRGESPTLATVFQGKLAQRARWERFAPPRTVVTTEYDLVRGLVFQRRLRADWSNAAVVDTNEVGIAFSTPPTLPDSVSSVDVDRIDAHIAAAVSVGLAEKWSQHVRNRQGVAAAGGDLLNFTIPIRLPRTLESIIGRGDATNIRISGQETISIGGQSSVRSDFIGNEIQQNQSYFPQLELQQTLRVNLDGQVGEKIKVRVSHNSDAVGSDATEVKLSFQGDEDDIIRTIRAGDIDVTLPGSRLLGVGASRGGLFGIKVEGALGPVEFTLVTSKEQAQQSDQTFNQSGGSEEEFVIRSVDYADRRFFRLMAPFPLYLGDFPGSPVDESGPFFVPVISGGPGWRIDYASLEVYLAIGAGIGDENTVDEGIALVDTTGVGWEGFGSGVFAGDSSSLAQALVDYPENKLVRRQRWKRLLRGQDWDPLEDANSNLIGVAMRRSYEDLDVLAVSYRILDDAGNLVRKVGRSIDDPDGPTVADPLDPEASVYVFKLLKPGPQNDPYSDPDPNDGVPGDFDPFALCWEYELRNYYDLRGRNIDLATLDLRIQSVDTSLEQPDRDEITGPDGIGTNLPWIRIFGLDQLDASGNPGSDDVADVNNRQVVDPVSGILQFPVARPFAITDADVSLFTDGAVASMPADQLTPDLYTRRIRVGSELVTSTKFNVVVRQSSVSSRLRLNAFNIRENSEEVILDGRVLQRGVDYDIDYFGGEVNLKGDALAALGAQSNIQVKFEVDPLFGGGRTSLSGMNLTYRFGRQNSLSTTWLYQTRPNSQTKIRFGEEPKKNWVGNLAAKLRFEPNWMASLARKLSREDSEQKPALSLDSEIALSLPDPNTRDEAYLEDFENVDQSTQMPMTREGWWWASLPVREDGLQPFGPEDRSYVGWHRAAKVLKREYVNPTLSEQEKRDVLSTLEMRVVAQDPEAGWRDNEYAGIMRSLGELDLTQAQFLEFWIDDGTGYVDPSAPQIERAALRPGRIHFDFGQMNEDFFWPREPDGSYVLNTWQQEDQDNDGLLGAPPGYGSEDRGLDGLLSEEEISSDPQPIFGVPPRSGDPAGDDQDATADYDGLDSVYLHINGTEGNQKLDSEDINRNGFLDTQDGYYSVTLELDDPNPLVDPYRDYANETDFVNESIDAGRSWRKYRLDLRDVVQRIRSDNLPYSAGNPDLSRVRFLRVWYEPEGDGSDPSDRRIRFSEMRFLGNRWVAEGVRDAYDDRNEVAGADGQDFRLGVLNNKDNPEYVPPIEPRIRNNIEELEQSLQFLYSDLLPGARVRARKDLTGRAGQDYLQYGELEFFWRAPFVDGAPAPEQNGVEPYFWVGSDSLNYYEVSFAFDEVSRTPDEWVQVRVDLAELTNVKVAGLDSLVAYPDGSGRPNPEVRRSQIRDVASTNVYTVTVRGRPDLRKVTRYYAGVRYPQRADGADVPRWTGEVLFNEIRLRKDLDDPGYAQRYSLNAQLPGLGDIAAEFSETDEDFRGLNQDRGSDILKRSWSVRTSTRVQNFIPTFGLDIPISVSKRKNLQLPKFQALSDIALLDAAARDEYKSEDESDSYTLQIRKPRPSDNKILQYTIDRFQFSINGARSTQTSPTQESASRSADQKYNYDLRLRQTPTIPLPFTAARLGVLPNQFTIGSNWRYSESAVTEIRLDGTRIERQPRVTKTNANNLSLSFQPLQSLRGGFSLQSNRDLLLGSQKVLGIDIGREDNFNQRVNFQYKPEFRWVGWAKPSIDGNAGYREDRKPGIRQRVPGVARKREILDPDGDGFLGEKGEVRNLSNSSDLNVRAELSVTGWLKGWLEGRERAAQAREAEKERKRNQQRAAEEALLPAAAPDSAATSAAPGSEEQGEEEDEEEDGDEGPVESAAPGLFAPGSSDSTQTTPVPAQDDRDAILARAREQARRRQEQIAIQRGEPVDSTATKAPTVSAPAPAEPEVVDDGGGGFDPLAPVDLLLKPVSGFIKNLRPISGNWQKQKQSGYQHVNGRANPLYRFGLSTTPDFSRFEPVPVDLDTDDQIVYQEYSSTNFQTTTQVRANTQSQFTKDLRVDMSYSRRVTQRDGTRGQSEDRTTEWPNVSLRVSRVHEWRFLNRWLNSSNIDVSYKKTETVQNATASTATFPRVGWSFQPRWSFRLENGLDTNLNVTVSDDRAENTQSFQFNKQFRANLRLQQAFDASGRLSFLRFGQRGTGTTIDMNVDISYSRQRNYREQKETGQKEQERGNNRWSVAPRFTYQFSRNLRGSARVEVSRQKDIARDATTTTVGLFFDATLTF